MPPFAISPRLAAAPPRQGQRQVDGCVQWNRRQLGWDVTLVRLGFVAGTLIGFGSLIIVYLAIGLVAD